MSDRAERILMALGDVQYIREYVIHELRRFDRLFSEKVYPPFADPEMQAERVAQERLWREKTPRPSVQQPAPERFLYFGCGAYPARCR